jgi:hypothetical protein
MPFCSVVVTGSIPACCLQSLLTQRKYRPMRTPFISGNYQSYQNGAVSNQLTDVGKRGDSVGQRVLNDLWRAMLSRGRMIWLLAHPFPPLPSESSTGDKQEDRERETSCWREGGEGWGGRGAESYDRKKAWSSINHSILSCVRVTVNMLMCARGCTVLYTRHSLICSVSS